MEKEFRACTNFGCRVKFKDNRRRKYCCSECNIQNQNNIARVKKLVIVGLSLDSIACALRDWKAQKIKHYYRLAKERCKTRQMILTTNIKDSGRILPEKYLIDSAFFYLPEWDRIPDCENIQDLTNDSPTIKEYLESINN